jgi:hypothetical protein
MPDWAAVTVGVILGAGLGLAGAYVGLAWYWHRNQP